MTNGGPNPQVAFVMMPFDRDFDDVYSAVKQAVSSIDNTLAVRRLDELRAAGSITEDLIEQIRTSAICIADVTDSNPNVMWEVGYAAALGKPVVAISQHGHPLPFDIKDVRTLMYDRRALAESLLGPLAEALRATLERYIGRRSALTVEQQVPLFRSIAVTGSTAIPLGTVRDRMERLLNPYIERGFHWYIGSYGNVDAAALQCLIEKREKSIAVVGYSSYDISTRVLYLMEKYRHVNFVDAAKEQMPKVPGAPSARDILFATRADLLILMWDGASSGTKNLLSWLSDLKKDHIIAFVADQ